MLVPYTHLNHVLASPYNDKFSNALMLKPVINFIEYLKSQVHCNIFNGLYGRNILEYNNAYNYYKGSEDSDKDYKKVIKYYYNDVATVVLNSKVTIQEDFTIYDNNSIPNLQGDKVTINLDSVIADINYYITGEGQLINEYNLDFNRILRYMPVHLDFESCPRLITEAVILKYFSEEPDVIFVEVV